MHHNGTSANVTSLSQFIQCLLLANPWFGFGGGGGCGGGCEIILMQQGGVTQANICLVPQGTWSHGIFNCEKCIFILLLEHFLQTSQLISLEIHYKINLFLYKIPWSWSGQSGNAKFLLFNGEIREVLSILWISLQIHCFSNLRVLGSLRVEEAIAFKMCIFLFFRAHCVEISKQLMQYVLVLGGDHVCKNNLLQSLNSLHRRLFAALVNKMNKCVHKNKYNNNNNNLLIF